MRRIVYVTYNEPVNGIYHSQVVDVVKYLRNELGQNIQLISFLPVGKNIRSFFEQRKKVKCLDSRAIVVPTLPIRYGWKFNSYVLALIFKLVDAKCIISREIFATYLALKVKRWFVGVSVCHDGRGANAAQEAEYGIYSNKIRKDVQGLEDYAVSQSDFRIAVSNNLVQYWQKEFNYRSDGHVFIPCTISSRFIKKLPDSDAELLGRRMQMGFKEDDIVLVYAGSSYGWQSFSMIKNFCEHQLRENANIKILFLSKRNAEVEELEVRHPGRVLSKWCSFETIWDHLAVCDYGILLREDTITNSVSFPTKFAEYLGAGLPVLISGNLEPAMIVRTESCGHIIDNQGVDRIILTRVSLKRKHQIIGICRKYFLKSAELNKCAYQKLLAECENREK